MTDKNIQSSDLTDVRMEQKNLVFTYDENTKVFCSNFRSKDVMAVVLDEYDKYLVETNQIYHDIHEGKTKIQQTAQVIAFFSFFPVLITMGLPTAIIMEIIASFVAGSIKKQKELKYLKLKLALLEKRNVLQTKWQENIETEKLVKDIELPYEIAKKEKVNVLKLRH